MKSKYEKHPGYKYFTLKPEMGTFEFAEGGIDTPYGRIGSAWKKTDTGYSYTCHIPENTTATIVLGGERKEIGSGEYTFTV